MIYGDLLIIASQAPQAAVVAYDKVTGYVKWSTPSLGSAGYVSPAPVKVGNEIHIVMITTASGGRGTPLSGGKVVGIEPLSGKILWEYENWKCVIPTPGAYDAGEGKVLIVGGYEAGAAMIEVEKADNGYNGSAFFKTIEFGAHTKPPVMYNGNFYAMYTTNERRDGMVCLNMDGQIMWKTKRKPLFDKGSMILADGLILATDGRTKLYLIEPDPSDFKPPASVELLKSGQNWPPIALADGKLLIRDQSKLICLKVAE